MSKAAQARAQYLYDSGRYQKAEAAVLEILATDATRSDAYQLLAKIEYSLGNANREREALERALALGESDAGRLQRLASLHARQGDQEAAATVYRRAIETRPDDLLAYQGLSRALFAQQDLTGLDRLAIELQERFPEAAFTHLLDGHLKKAVGDFSGARESYEQAVELEPTLGEALFGIVDLGIPVDDTLKQHVATLASQDDLSRPDSINASFAYARMLDQAREYGEAFRFFQRANNVALEELAGRGIIYEPKRVEKRVEHTINDYPANSFESPLDPLPIDLAPIFVVGLPRSGTTLIEQILASHPDVEAGGELAFAQQCEQRFRQSRQAAGRQGPIDPTHDEDAKLLEEARERYVDAVFERDLDGPWIVDKMPASFQIAGFLRLMFPNAPIVHTVRDPRATCFSLYTANFAAHEPYYHSLEHLAHYYSQYVRLIRHWREVLSYPYLELAYEDLVRDPQTHIPALLQDVGLSAHPDCLTFYDHERPVLTASHTQVRRPIYTSAIDHWRHYESWLGALQNLPPHDSSINCQTCNEPRQSPLADL